MNPLRADQPLGSAAGGRSVIPLDSGLAPISAAVRVGDLLFLSGCVALDPATGLARGDTVTIQARDVFDQIALLLGQAGAELGDVVRCVCYLTDPGATAAFDRVFAETFPLDPPARTTVICGLARPGLLVEVEVTAWCQ